MIDIDDYIHVKKMPEKYILPDWKKAGKPDITSKNVDDKFIDYYIGERECYSVPWQRVYGAAEWKSMKKAVKAAAEYAEIPQEYVDGLDKWAFK